MPYCKQGEKGEKSGQTGRCVYLSASAREGEGEGHLEATACQVSTLILWQLCTRGRSRSRYLIYFSLLFLSPLSPLRHHTYLSGLKENFAYRNQTKSKKTDMLRPSLKFILRQSVPDLRQATGTPRSISIVGSGRRQGRFKVLYLLIFCCG